MRGQPVLPILATLALAACDRNPVTAPASPDPAVAARAVTSASQPIDVSGSWSWREVVVLQVPEAGALEFFGVQPEGPVTVGRCVNTGVLELVQDGATFRGTATQIATCVSQGGQVFSPPAFTPTLDVRDGEIRGHAVRFVFGAGDVPCLHHATIAEIEDGTAVRLRGGGRCIPPGHPLSPLAELELPFPSGPISPTIYWEATRP